MDVVADRCNCLVIYSHLFSCRLSSWTCCFAAVSSCITWRNTQKRPRKTLLARCLDATPPCWTTASLSVSVPWCPSEEPLSEGCCQGLRFGLESFPLFTLTAWYYGFNLRVRLLVSSLLLSSFKLIFHEGQWVWRQTVLLIELPPGQFLILEEHFLFPPHL